MRTSLHFKVVRNKKSNFFYRYLIEFDRESESGPFVIDEYFL